MDGQIAVGWLVVEDVATVLILVLLPPLAGLLGSDAAPGITGRTLRSRSPSRSATSSPSSP